MRSLASALLPLLPLLFSACGDDGAGTTDTTLPEVDIPQLEVDVADTAETSETTPIDTTPDSTDTAAPDTTAPDTSADTTPADTTTPDTTADTSDTGPTDTTSPDTTADTASDADTVKPNCVTLPADHTRHIVISRPYSENGTPSLVWEVYPVLNDGTLGARTDTFELGAAGRAVGGKVAFTDDGALAMAYHDRGEVSVFAIDGDGGARVIQPATDLGPYVGGIVIHGDDVFLVDGNWQNNGGGIYHTTLGCDGSLGAITMAYPTKLAYALEVRGAANNVEHLVMAKEAVDTTTGHVHRVQQAGAGWSRMGALDIFGDNEAMTSSMAVTPDWRYVLVADNSEFSNIPNRIGVATVEPLAARQTLTPFDDPYDMVMSPYGDAVLVVLGYANRVTVLRHDPQNTTTPFTNAGPPTFVTQVPQLPSEAVRLHGDLEDLVYVVENTALRVFRFNGDGTVTDLGRQIFGEGLTSIPGAIGAQP
ncbi:MAG TPA: hypothetical protein PK095_09480 [Myxococcota bacterium]|nr:hypothetical protein [Myxococcota bacterium]